jgi:hypothetical protein
MTYDGTMVLPRNSVAMSSNEMTYVEGGKTLYRYGTAQDMRNVARNWKLVYMAAAIVFGAEARIPVVGGIAWIASLSVGRLAARYMQAEIFFASKSPTRASYLGTVYHYSFATDIVYG